MGEAQRPASDMIQETSGSFAGLTDSMPKVEKGEVALALGVRLRFKIV
jgi:hypothetical protein